LIAKPITFSLGCEWGIMRGIYFAAFACANLFIAGFVSSVHAGDNRLQRLIELQKNYESYLQRVEKGSPPCHLDSCQLEKYSLVESLHQLVTPIPTRVSWLVRDFDRAIFSAYRLASSPPPYFTEEETRSDRLRYQAAQHMEWRGSWQAAAADLFLLRKILETYFRVTQDPYRQSELKTLIGRGLLEMTYHMAEGQKWKDKHTAALWTDDYEAQEKSKHLVESHFEEYHRLRLAVFSGTGKNWNSLFPELNEAETQQMLQHLRHWKREHPETWLFGAQSIRTLSRAHHIIRKAIQTITAFNDLEFGVVGLNNFESISNPERRTHKDIEYLQIHRQQEARTRGIFQASDYLIRWMVFHAWLGPSFARTAWGVAAYEIFNVKTRPIVIDEYGGRRRTELEAASREYAEQMQRRHSTLLETQDTIVRALSQVEAEIQFLRGENHHEDTAYSGP